jgi:hypothetical protein
MKYILSLTDAQFQGDSRDLLTQSQRFDEFQRTGNIVAYLKVRTGYLRRSNRTRVHES